MTFPSLAARVERRHRALRLVRRYLDEGGFLEVDAPMLVPTTTPEPHIDPLCVQVRAGLERAGLERAAQRRYLHTSPELALKRLLAEGLPKIYCLAHVFRDGERGERHLPEFFLLEWYRAGARLEELVEDCRRLLGGLARELTGSSVVPGPAGPLDLGAEPEVRTVAELFEEHAGVDLRAALERMREGDAMALVAAARAAGHKLREGADFEDAFFHVMVARVEPRIGLERPCVVRRWPAQMAVLARRSDDDPLFAERFELYAGGLELANAFDELTDPGEQRARFLEDNAARVALGKEPLPLDELFLSALERMPPSVGIALGFDRALMLALSAARIDEVVPLPFR
jgi:elongation factor P--(R)-beta-lysine ligase